MNQASFTRTGVITGFTGGVVNQPVDGPASFSLAELRSRIDKIRTDFDPDVLYTLITQILSHTQNTNNPHHVTLAQVGVDVMQLVYQTWLDAGNTGTLSDFEAILFQTTSVASLADIASGTSSNLVPASAVTTLIATHNTDPTAHQALFDVILPGSPPAALPSYAMDAHIGIPPAVVVTRSTPILLLDRGGNLVSVPANTMGIDYANNTPTYPVYGARTNSVFPSNPQTASGSNLVGTTLSSSPSGTLQVGPDQLACAVLTESTNTELHGYQIPVTVVAGVEYTASVFLYPLVTTGGITLYLDSDPSLAIMLDLNTNLISSTNPNVIGHIHVLNNGFLRIGLQYLAASSTAAHVMVIKTPTAVLGTSALYLGTSQPLFGLFGLQQVIGAGLSPYIPTTTAPASHDNTVMSVTVPLENAVTGLFSLAFNQPKSLLAPTRTLLTVATNVVLSTLNGQLTATTHNTDSTTSTLSQPVTYNSFVVAAFSFAAALLKLATTGNSKLSLTGKTLNVTAGTVTVTFGDPTTAFDGQLQSFTLYPIADTTEEIEFLLGGVP